MNSGAGGCCWLRRGLSYRMRRRGRRGVSRVERITQPQWPLNWQPRTPHSSVAGTPLPCRVLRPSLSAETAFSIEDVFREEFIPAYLVREQGHDGVMQDPFLTNRALRFRLRCVVLLIAPQHLRPSYNLIGTRAKGKYNF